MPELPEVETVRRTLAERVVGRTIEGVEVLSGSAIGDADPTGFERALVGQTIEAVDRRGKYLLVRLTGGDLLVIHLRMTGRLVRVRPRTPRPEHTRLLFRLSGGFELRLIDQRRFARAYLAPQGDVAGIKGLAGAGVEPLSAEFGPECLADILNRRSAQIKPLLLDQRRIAGVGNIYADEALFRSGIHPRRQAGSLTSVEVAALAAAIVSALRDGLRYGGTTIRSYADARGVRGRFQERLNVYGRRGKPCRACGTPIEREKVGGRGTHFCPRCQA